MPNPDRIGPPYPNEPPAGTLEQSLRDVLGGGQWAVSAGLACRRTVTGHDVISITVGGFRYEVAGNRLALAGTAPPVALTEADLAELGVAAELLRLGKTYGDCEDCRVEHAHDGDTFTVTVPGWPRVAGEHIEVRLYGVDAPELHDPRPEVAALAVRARERLAELVQTGLAPRVRLLDLRRDKYFRLLARVTVGNVSVADTLLAEGLVRPYAGVGPKPWQFLA